MKTFGATARTAGILALLSLTFMAIDLGMHLILGFEHVPFGVFGEGLSWVDVEVMGGIHSPQWSGGSVVRDPEFMLLFLAARVARASPAALALGAGGVLVAYVVRLPVRATQALWRRAAAWRRASSNSG